MANSWLRLWHEMPNDPKWRTIAKASGQSIGNVIAVYVHLLVCASNATERGRTQSFCSEDVASALDLETEHVEQILSSMQGRVLDGDLVKGWSKRQVEREDGAAARAKAWREAQKQAKTVETNATERNRTQCEREQTPDKDTDTEYKNSGAEQEKPEQPASPAAPLPPEKTTKGTRLPVDWTPDERLEDWAKQERPDLDLDSTVSTFQDFWRSKPGKDGTKLDWNATFRNWVRSTKTPVRPNRSTSLMAGVI